jgi:hypothetical protein
MLKCLLLWIIIILSATKLLASILYIAINPNECSSCTIALSFTKHINSNEALVFVLQERNVDDSSTIAESLFLNDYQAQFVWSDSLFNAVSTNGYSTVTMFSADGSRRFEYPLKIFTASMAEGINRLSKRTDTIRLDKTNIAEVGTNEIYSKNSQVFFINRLKRKILAYDKIPNKVLYTLSIDDSIINQTYDMALGKGAHQFHRGIVKQLKVPRANVIQQFWYHNDAAYVIMDNTYLQAVSDNKQDTVVASFYAMHVFHNDALQQTYILASEPILYKNDTLNFFPALYPTALGLVGPVFKSRMRPPLYVLAHYGLNKNFVVPEKILPYTLPPIYKSNSYYHPVFYDSYFTFPLEDNIYNFLNQDTIHINSFPKNNVGELFKPPHKYVSAIAVVEDTVYMLYYVVDTKQYHYLQYHKKDKKVLIDKLIPSNRSIPVIDDWDPACIYYSIDNNTLVRTHITSL